MDKTEKILRDVKGIVSNITALKRDELQMLINRLHDQAVRRKWTDVEIQQWSAFVNEVNMMVKSDMSPLVQSWTKRANKMVKSGKYPHLEKWIKHAKKLG